MIEEKNLHCLKIAFRYFINLLRSLPAASKLKSEEQSVSKGSLGSYAFSNPSQTHRRFSMKTSELSMPVLYSTSVKVLPVEPRSCDTPPESSPRSADIGPSSVWAWWTETERGQWYANWQRLCPKCHPIPCQVHYFWPGPIWLCHSI